MNGKPIIHVIDDDDAVRDSIGMSLQAEGFVVRLYPSGVAFLHEVASLHEADLANTVCLVIDMHLPGLSGAAILGLLRSWGIPVRVVAMTNISDVESCCTAVDGNALLLGAAVLEKPFSGTDLVRSIEIASRRG
jgi:two-component system response regulator FixJ